MKVYVLIECTCQDEYTEGKCYSSAAPAREIIGVYGNVLKAHEEKDRLNALADAEEDMDGESIYYEVETHTVE